MVKTINIDLMVERDILLKYVLQEVKIAVETDGEGTGTVL
jgi:hypothetical protein